MARDTLAVRMKDYENRAKTRLINKIPVIIRVDGRAFKTFTKNFVKPFDELITDSMQKTMLYLCQNIQNCQFAYTQSDEITLVLCDYMSDETDAWFGNQVQKITSISAAMTTWCFNKQMNDTLLVGLLQKDNYSNYLDEIKKPAVFDARAFNLPIDEVVNCLIWRQCDAIRNSIRACGRTMYKHKELNGVCNTDLIEKMKTEHGFDWNTDVTISNQRGSCAYKVPKVISEGRTREKWCLDTEPPLFTLDREYIKRHIT